MLFEFKEDYEIKRCTIRVHVSEKVYNNFEEAPSIMFKHFLVKSFGDNATIIKSLRNGDESGSVKTLAANFTEEEFESLAKVAKKYNCQTNYLAKLLVNLAYNN